MQLRPDFRPLNGIYCMIGEGYGSH